MEGGNYCCMPSCPVFLVSLILGTDLKQKNAAKGYEASKLLGAYTLPRLCAFLY